MTSAIARLNDFGQSPWYDNITRTLVREGGLAAADRRGRDPRRHVEPDDLRQGDRGRRGLRRPAARAAPAGRRRRGRVLGARGRRHRRRRGPAPPDLRPARPRRRLHLDRGVAPARARHEGDDRAGRRAVRAARPAEHPHQDPGDARGHPRDRGDDRGGHQRQRHADLQPRPPRRGHRGVPQGARAVRRRWRRPGRASARSRRSS